MHCGKCIDACNHFANSFDENGKYSVRYHHCTMCQHCLKVCPVGAITLDSHDYADFQTGMAVWHQGGPGHLCPGQRLLHQRADEHHGPLRLLGHDHARPGAGHRASWPRRTSSPSSAPSLDAIKMEDLIPAGVPAGMELSGHGHLFEQLHGKNPYIQLQKLEEQGLGTQEYATTIVK